jgi:predicted transcriptional regulator
MTKKNRGFRLSDEAYRQLETLAERHGRSQSNVIEIALDRFYREETMTQHTISVDNGLTATTPEAALAKHDMDTIANYMDDDIRERVHMEPDSDFITEAEFIRRYLRYADLVIG